MALVPESLWSTPHFISMQGQIQLLWGLTLTQFRRSSYIYDYLIFVIFIKQNGLVSLKMKDNEEEDVRERLE